MIECIYTVFRIINPLMPESVSNFGIFQNFNFPKNTFKYSKIPQSGSLQKDKTSKISSFLCLKIFGILFTLQTQKFDKKKEVVNIFTYRP